MHMDLELVSNLQYRNRSLSKQVEDFRSGEKYRKMDAENKRLIRFHNREMKRMEYELSKAHSETVTVRRYWSEVMEELDKEHKEEINRLLSEIKRLGKRISELERQRDEAKEKLHGRSLEYYALAGELEEEKGTRNIKKETFIFHQLFCTCGGRAVGIYLLRKRRYFK